MEFTLWILTKALGTVSPRLEPSFPRCSPARAGLQLRATTCRPLLRARSSPGASRSSLSTSTDQNLGTADCSCRSTCWISACPTSAPRARPTGSSPPEQNRRRVVLRHRPTRSAPPIGRPSPPSSCSRGYAPSSPKARQALKLAPRSWRSASGWLAAARDLLVPSARCSKIRAGSSSRRERARHRPVP